MDFKDRHPAVSVSMFDGMINREAPSYAFASDVSEMYLPSLDALFLAVVSPASDLDVTLCYLIEAPKDCKMRAAFAYSEISWNDYWSHKNWLIELRTQFDGPLLSCRYIHPAEIDYRMEDRLEKNGLRGPIQRYIENCENTLNSKFRFDSMDYEEVARTYETLMREHGPRLFKSKAA